MIRKAALAASSLAIAGLLALSPAPAEAQDIVTCESHGGDRAYCSADTRGGVRLVRQLSNARCENGRSWGADRRGIWVSNGCRAQFALGRGNARGGWGDSRDERYDNRSSRGATQQVERICRGAVSERYRDVRRADVEARYRGTDRAGNAVVRWTTGRAAGSCTVSPRGRVLDLRVTRR